MGSHSRIVRGLGSWALPSVAAALLLGACDERDAPAGAAQTTPSAPVDRLAPKERPERLRSAFGLVAPEPLVLEAKFEDSARFAGRIGADDLVARLKPLIVASVVELAGESYVFRRARIRSGDRNRVYQLEVIPRGPLTRLIVRDVTPPPSRSGLSESERWKQAGRTPDGKVVDPRELQ